jgi:hypothetical protein
MANIPLDFDTLNQYGCFIGSAAIVVFSDHDSAADTARNLLNFFSKESCGQCTPCRVGTAKAVQLMEEKQWDEPLLKELSSAMVDARSRTRTGAPVDPVRLETFSGEGNSGYPFVPAERRNGRLKRTRPFFKLPISEVLKLPCYKDGMRPDGNCRTCMVEVKGERVLAPSCCQTRKGWK